MPSLLTCDCVNLPMCMVEWSMDKYIFFNPGKPYELHVPYEILNSKFTQERIVEVWRSQLHRRFCPNTGFLAFNNCHISYGRVLFFIGKWLCNYAKPAGYPREGQTKKSCWLIKRTSPRSSNSPYSVLM